jgi:NitT/TauT family transport system permease protein
MTDFIGADRIQLRPKVAVIPVLVIWFGIGTVPAVIAFAPRSFPSVNVATGIATVEPDCATF